MKNMTVKAKLLLVTAISALAVALVGIIGEVGIQGAHKALERVGEVRLPSIIGLAIVNEGQTALRAANREAPFYENDYKAQDKFAAVAKQKAEIWARIDKGWKIYEPLPQEPEEAQVWKQFEKEWALWKQGEAAVTATIEALAANRTEAGQKQLFEKLYRQLEEQKKPFADAEASLGKVVSLNEKYAEADRLAGEATVAKAQVVMIATGLIAIVIVLVLSLLMVRDLLRALGGEPAVAAEAANRIAQGDLVSAVPVKAGDTTSLMAAMAGMREKLAGIVGRINEASGAIHTAASEIASGNQDLASRTEEQASSLEETASSMEELTTTVRQSADNAQQADQLAASASTVAGRGGEVVAEVVRTMASINDSSRKIADIIGVIDGIAFQTNILALNAAVEAARAGEQGRGFAVVASEVRTLAQRSAEAAKEIKGLITDSVGKVETGSKLVDDAGRTIDEVVVSVRRVTDVMAEITAAAREQSAGIGQVNDAVVQMDKVTQQNAALVEEAAAAAESMQKQAEELRQMVSIFQVSAGGTHAPVAAAPVAARRTVSATVTPIRAARPAPPKAAPRAARVANSDVHGEDWKEF